MYNYEQEKHKIFTDIGQREFLKVRDHVQECLKKSGAVRMLEAMSPTGISGSSWTMLAYVDRLVELGEIREIIIPGVAGQDRVFVKKG